MSIGFGTSKQAELRIQERGKEREIKKEIKEKLMKEGKLSATSL